MINEQVISTLAEILQQKHGFATTTMLDKAVADLLRRTQERSAGGKPAFSLSKMIRGLRALHGEPINPQSAEDDVKYLRALTTGATPGSYLVPNIQAEEIVAYLSIGGILRASGARIWPMNGIQKMTVPTALGAPTWVWMAQNSVQHQQTRIWARWRST